MQVEINSEGTFKPFEIKIKVETIQDLISLYVRHNAHQGCYTEDYWEECKSVLNKGNMKINGFNNIGANLFNLVDDQMCNY